MDRDMPSPPMQTFKSILAEELKDEETEIQIFLTGRTGHGKSSLLNSILELKESNQFKEGDKGLRCTTKVTTYRYDVTPGLSIKLFDSPGLQDATGEENSYIRGLKEECGEVNLALICKSMIDYRLSSDDKLALKKLHSAFGDEFWKHVVFIFTFANKDDYSKRSDIDQDPVEKEPHRNDDEGWDKLEKQRLQHRVKVRGDTIKEFIVKEVEVDRMLVEDIPFIPAGYHTLGRREHFILQSTWLSDLLKRCTHRMKDDLGLAKLNLNNKFNLAIIINNDNDDNPESDPPLNDKGNNETVSIPPAMVYSEQAMLIQARLKELGFAVLYFSNLTAKGITQLLRAFSKAGHTDISAFTLVVLSKGKEPLIYDADGEVVPFEEILQHFTEEGPIADMPKSFFFHLTSDTEPPDQLARFNTPKNSVALLVARQKMEDKISPAVSIYLQEIGKCYTTHIQKNFQSMRDIMRTQQSTQCELLNSFLEDIIMPSCYKPSSTKAKAVYLHNKLQFYRSLWWPIREETASELVKCIDDVMAVLKACRIAKITGSSASVGLGGFLSVLGLALIPFTFGGSTVLTVAGAGVMAAGAAAGISAGIVKLVKGKAQLEGAQKCINLDQQLSYHVNIALEEYGKVARDEVKEDILKNITKITATVGVLGGAVVEGAAIAVGRGAEAIGIRVGGLVAEVVAESVAETGMIGAGFAGRAAAALVRPLVGQAVEGAVEAGAVAARVAGTGLRVVGGVAALAVAVPLDIYQIVDSSIALANTGGKSEKDAVFQYIMKKVESLIKGLGHPISEVGKTFKGNEEIMIDVQDEYGFRMKNGRFDQKEDEESDASVHVMYAGPFALPEGATLASAIYDIKAEKKLKEPVTVEIQHCVEIDEQVYFAIATLDKETKKFAFNPVEDMKYSFDAKSGSVELKELNCLICILHYKDECQYNQMKYAALCSYSRVSRNYWKMDIIPVKQLAAHITHVQANTGILVGFPFKFDSKQCSIEIEDPPDKNMKAHKVNGWLITPCDVENKNMIEREEIDDLEIQEQWKEFQLPYIQLDIAAVDEKDEKSDEKSDKNNLKYSLHLKGTSSSVTVACAYEKSNN